MRASVKYVAIEANKDKYPISFICKFFSVSRSGYYAWYKQKGRHGRDEVIGNLIKDCQEKTKKTYGYRRVKLWLLRETGLVINHKAVLRLMRKYNIQAEIRRPRPLYQRQARMNIFENRLNRDFRASRPNEKWVTDISYIHTNQGVLYLSMIKDLYDNYIVAYDTGRAQDQALVNRTIKKAIKEAADGLVLHSDQGSQYASKEYLELIKHYSILPSMSRAGSPLDNAPAENFFGILKTECIYRHKIQSISDAEQLVDEYINFYNFERIQLKTKLTPFEKRCQFA
ncbi:MAG: IS3 family transposase [Eubacteriales bacterium]